ncbi:fumarylacetoacetate hydrolase family protein [Gilvimarinus sp. SDUM040013]|uniref:Fumarylacetoacetate hydrolase family protein n=1 Tax=Gilvimarinus gilvus TaxID=3058038 RepID=A0ABU4S0E1_9GAMM|nr:fumarylacetoacetate hydrolase family protein [Gilvimarinus sp. SDUM040013]MDO3385877.1 fumarylacetoacetate hydrolase family protein [Gilvimarinus sp. SDUM040013]MDX6850620.1 fumarylacetoacetate hydrolase family protein [Gilvimarinus sp. SDUM040013]
MKIYKLNSSILLEYQDNFYQLEDESWDSFINDDYLDEKVKQIASNLSPISNSDALLKHELDAPVVGQELWASGVTYIRSKQGRQEESAKAGGSDFYARVYEADRPELFFKATRNRIVGHGGEVRIRRDSNWDVPEPELVLLMSSSGKIIGYTIGNDMSSRSIEGENPLYLPQAKTYDGCAALGPCILVAESPLKGDTNIRLTIERDNEVVFNDSIAINQIKRGMEELAGFLFRECSFPQGALLMTGTGIVPGNDFTLQAGDCISISVDGIGTLTNCVARNT